MADKRENNPAGRMLFTDFDASEKGRPETAAVAASSGGRTADFLNRPIPTIEELASSLELDFEDDWGEEADETPVVDLHSTEDEAPGIDSTQTTIANDDGLARSRFIPPDQPTATPSPVTTDKEERQIPSNTQPWLEPEQPASSRNSHTSLDEDDPELDLDILSALPATPGDVSGLFREDETAEPWQGRRLGVSPPPVRPYGGIERVKDWYLPPEWLENEENPSIENWYEPPSPETVEEAEETSRSEQDGGSGIDLLAADSRKGGTEEQTKAEEDDRHTATDTRGIDMFADVDLETLWENRVRRSEQNRSKRQTNPEANDIFADIDLDSAWEEKRQRVRSESSRLPAIPFDISNIDDTLYERRTKENDKDATVFVDPDAVHNRMPPEEKKAPLEPPKKKSDTPKTTPEADKAPARPTRKKKRRRKAPPPELAATSDTLDFLDDLESLFEDDEDEAGVQEEKAQKASVSKVESQPQADQEELDLASLISEVDADYIPDVADDVEIPNLDEVDISPIETRPGEPALSDIIDENGESDVSFLDKLDAEAMDADVAENIQAPVIDDSAIVGLSGPSRVKHDDDNDTDTVELETLTAGNAEDTDKSESGNDAAEASGEETQDEEKSAAVNPMDVFANMENMDFSGDSLDDEMKAMLEEGAEPEAEPEPGDAISPTPEKALPSGIKGKALALIRRIPWLNKQESFIHRLQQAIAWHENWWFYCDLLAAVVISASLAVILSYYLWYK